VKIVPILYGTAAVLALSGLYLRVARPAMPAVDPAQLRLPAGGQQQPAAAGDVAPAGTNDQLIVAQNIFSQTRGPEPAKTAPTPRAGKPRNTGPDFALRGTTIGPRGAVALIGAEVHRVGDIVDGARLVAITDSTVTLERSSGPLVLHVPTSQHKKL
jgi:hypothetical protein